MANIASQISATLDAQMSLLVALVVTHPDRLALLREFQKSILPKIQAEKDPQAKDIRLSVAELIEGLCLARDDTAH